MYNSGEVKQITRMFPNSRYENGVQMYTDVYRCTYILVFNSVWVMIEMEAIPKQFQPNVE